MCRQSHFSNGSQFRFDPTDPYRRVSPISGEKNRYRETHETENPRLGYKHRIRYPHMLNTWHRVGISTGSKVIDADAGTGNTSLDLTGIIEEPGPEIALERSDRFLKALNSAPGSAVSKILIRKPVISSQVKSGRQKSEYAKM